MKKTDNNTSLITYNTVFQLNNLLGKLKIKSLDHSLFINIIQLKCAINKIIKDHSEIAEEIQKEFEVAPNVNGSIEFKSSEKDKANAFFKAFESLGKREVEIQNIRILSPDSFQLIHTENDLNVDELVLLNEYLVN